MQIAVGRVGLNYPEEYGQPSCVSYPSRSFCASEQGIFGVVRGVTGRDPAMRYADCIASTICEGMLRAVCTYSGDKEFHDTALLRQFIIAGSEALIELGQEKGGPLILSKSSACVAIARLQSYDLDIAYIGDVQLRLIRSGRVEFRNMLHTFGDTMDAPFPFRYVLTKALGVPQNPTLIDIQQVSVQPGDLVFMSSSWVMDSIMEEKGMKWAEYLTAFGADIENASQQVASLMQSSDLLSRVHHGAAWALAFVE